MMGLKLKIASLDDVAEPLRSAYTQQADGTFALDVDGAVSREKLDEFRTNNVSLQKRLDELTKAYAGIDPEKARALEAEAQQAREAALAAAGKTDELVNSRTAAMKSSYEAQMAELQKSLASTSRHLEAQVIDNAIRAAAAKSSVHESAVDDVLLRGRAVFQLRDGKAIAVDRDNNALFGKTGDPVGIDEWVGGLLSSAPHLFKSSSGAGARGGSTTGPAQPGTISSTDSAAFLANLDGIAKGKVKVS